MKIRKAIDADFGFIYETFLRSIRAASTHVEELSNSEVVSLLASLIKKGWQCEVADAEGYLAGWIVAAGRNHLGWIYVRDMFRWHNYKDNPVRDMLLTSGHIDISQRMITPFLPNRNRNKWHLVNRPFLIV